MTRRERLERRVRRFAADRSSGAAELAAAAVALLRDAERAGYTAPQRARLARRLADAHPAMAAVWNAVHAKDPAGFLEAAHRSARATLAAARRHVPRRATVVTLSYSSTVLRALQRRDLVVLVAESLPGGEGRRVVRLLRRGGVRADLIPDSELGRAARLADLAMTGADAVTRHEVINKVGTALLALAAREAAIPCYVVADASKLAGPGWAPPECRRGSAFERVRRSLFTKVITVRR